jgi:outer membrane protein OmpA-like peptidoglycan-associated protein
MIRFLTVLLLFSISHLYAQEHMRVSRCYKVDWSAPIVNIFIDQDQNKWVSTDGNLFQVLACDLIDQVDLQPDQKSILQIRDGNCDLKFSLTELVSEAGTMMENDEYIRTAHFDSLRNELWIGTTYSGVLVFQTDASLRLKETINRRNSKLNSDLINTIYLDSRGRLWVGTDAGVLVRSGRSWDLLEKDYRFDAITEFSSTVGLLSENRILLASSNNVITRKELDPASYRGNIRDIAFGPDGLLWMASNVITRYDLESDQFTIYDGPAYFTSELATCIEVDDQNVAWVGTDDKGLYVIEKESSLVAMIELEEGLSCEKINRQAELQVKVSGGDPPYEYHWQTGISGPNPTNAGPGTHSVVVTDSKGKSTRAQINIPDPTLAFIVNIRNDINPDTVEFGAAEVIVERGVAPFTFSWDNGETDRIATNLTFGDHSVTVTAGNGCTEEQTVSIKKPGRELAVFVNEIIKNKCPGQEGGSFKVRATGGQVPYTYAWNEPELTGAEPDGLSAGNYRVTVTDALGNADSTSVTISDPPEIKLSLELVSPSNIILGNGQALARVSGGTGNYSFLWDNGEEISLAKNLDSGIHSLTVTDANGCIATSSIDIPEYVPGLSISFNQTAVNLCNGDTKAAIEVEVQGGKEPFQLSWNDPSLSGNQLLGLAAGNYTVTVSDQAEQTASSSIFVREPPPITITTVVIEPGSTGNEDGIARVEASGGNGSFSYLWDNGETTLEATKLAPGEHFITVTDIHDCAAVASVRIPENVFTLAANISQTKPVACSGGDEAEVLVEVLGGNPPFQYEWNKSGLTGNRVSGLSAGEYSVTITDNSGQIEIKTIAVLDPKPLTARATQINPADTDVDNGRASVDIIGGTGNYSIDWANGERGQTASRLSSGIHHVTVTDDHDCLTTDSVEIDEKFRPLSIDLVQTKENMCVGDSAAALHVQLSGGKGPFQYKWNIDSLSGNQVSGIPAGTYRVTVTDAAGQFLNKSITVRDPIPLKATASMIEPASVGAADGKATVKASGGNGRYFYKWDNGEAGEQATILTSGTHIVTVTDGNQCPVTANVIISERISTLAIDLRLIRGNPCGGSSLASLQVEAEGGKQPYQYRWSNRDLQGNRVTGLSAGNYQVTVLDASGQSKSSRIRIIDPPALAATTYLESIGGIQRAGVKASGGTGNYTYRWDNGETNAIADTLGPGVHSVAVRDENGCSVTASIEMPDEMFPLSVELVQIKNNPCTGDKNAAIEVQTLGGKSPFNFKWNDSVSSENVRTNLQAGVYEVTVTDSNDEQFQASIEIKDPKQLNVNAVLIQPASTGNTNGQATAIASGGTGNHSFLWGDGETFPMRSDLGPGRYSVKVVDENGCIAEDEIEIPEDILPLTLNLELEGQNLCPGDKNGSIIAQISGGKPPYQYNWSDSNFSDDNPSNLSGGNYSVTIVDAAGNSVAKEISISEPAPLKVNAVATKAASTGGSDGQARITATGGTGNYLYSWDNGESTMVANSLDAGTHSVTVVDDNGCTAISEVNISEDILPLTVELDQVAFNSCSGDRQAGIRALVSGGKQPFRYQWNSDDLNGDQVSGLDAGTYSLTVSDAMNNLASGEVIITDPEPLTIQITHIQPANTNQSDGQASVVASGGTGKYTYLWDNGETEITALKLGPGPHSVTVTDQNNCATHTEFQVTEDILPLAVNLIETSQNMCSGDTKAAIQVHLSGGKGPYQYIWNQPGLQGDRLTSIPAGFYAVTVTDAVNNETIASLTIDEPAPLEIMIDSLNPAITGQSDGYASVSVSGGKGTYTYQWDNGSAGSFISQLPPGIHSVTVTDENGCIASVQVQISEHILPLAVDLIQTSEIQCAGADNAEILVQLSGGKGPFQYLWDDTTLVGSQAAGLGKGTYSLTVTDAVNQTGTASLQIDAPPELTVSVTEPRPATDESSSDGKAQVVAQGGTPPYSISWDNDETGTEAVRLSIGTHEVTVTDELGCTSSVEFEIHKKILPQLSANRLRSGQLIRMEQLFFEADSADLEETSIPVLEELYGFMKDNPSIVVRVEGHTNDLPPHEFCDWLSTERAKAVAEYIVQKGIASERVYYRGYGKRQPVYSNLTAEGRRLNQRVEINILQIGGSNVSAES